MKINDGLHPICSNERKRCRNLRALHAYQLKACTFESRTSEGNTRLMSRARYASTERCARIPAARDFHSAAIVINIRVLRASRTDRRRSRLCQARFYQRDASGSAAFYPRLQLLLQRPLLPLHLRKEITATRSYPGRDDDIIARTARDAIVASIFQTRNSPEAARGRTRERERERNRGSLTIKVARGGRFALRRLSYVLPPRVRC